MTWLRIGDTFWADPRILRAATLPDADARTVNELAGFLVRLGSYAAQYGTDYLIHVDLALTMPGVANPQRLIRMLIDLGLAHEIPDGERSAIGLIEDPDLLHMISKEEKAWRNQRVADSRNPDLMVPVRLRDGDQCRWCGHLVHWPGKTSNRKATLDHLVPGEPATVDTAVVACWSCNSARKDNPEWEEEHKLLEEPETPLYGKVTVTYLAKYGIVVTQNLGADRQLNMDNSCSQGRKPGVAPRCTTEKTRPRGVATSASGLIAPGSNPSRNDAYETGVVHEEDLGSSETTDDTEASVVSEPEKDSGLLTLTNHDLSGRVGVESESDRVGSGSVPGGVESVAQCLDYRRRRRGRKR
ncbi:hypothetical protein HHJ78_03445 [Mobiluncus mulieris]|uniref:HNH endonuclease n=1 Tax=Mobiluncus mulieris TaxID=2052 RepID=A0A378PDM5_9ACTO|nr:hypothetical protein [Mobiluncus mulieris]MCU9973882.1 hypothetical protein [Mobiluncus mulieris]NMW64607.1 hypothetical protein [Mobiluncus mulieris]NMW75156.1 hypothetical protein [Mobiluncus mulieris]STY84678.1 Uncharacterised protein [Mobiluncus mulieris]